MKIIVTGSTGFVGRHLVPKLLKDGHQVFEVTRQKGTSSQLFGNNCIKYVLTDDQESFKNSISKFQPEICIHLASFLSSEDDYSTMKKLLDSNILFLCRLLDALKDSGLRLFVNTGTFAEYFSGKEILNPSYFYAATKSASRVFVDYYSSIYNFKQVTVVPYTIYGGIDTRKKIIDIIYDSLDSKDSINLTPGYQILDFINIKDIVNFYILVIKEYKTIPNTSDFHLGTGTGHTLRELANIIETEDGRKTNINWGAKSYRAKDVFYAVANISLQYHLWKWRPKISLEQGVKEYINVRNREIKR